MIDGLFTTPVYSRRTVRFVNSAFPKKKNLRKVTQISSLSYMLSLSGRLANSRIDIYVITHSTLSLLHAKRTERLTSIHRGPRSVCLIQQWLNFSYFIKIGWSEIIFAQNIYVWLRLTEWGTMSFPILTTQEPRRKKSLVLVGYRIQTNEINKRIN